MIDKLAILFRGEVAENEKLRAENEALRKENARLRKIERRARKRWEASQQNGGEHD